MEAQLEEKSHKSKFCLTPVKFPLTFFLSWTIPKLVSPTPWSISVSLLFCFLMKEEKGFCNEASRAGFLHWSVESENLVVGPEDVQKSLSLSCAFVLLFISYDVNEWLSKCGPRTSRSNITWELTGNADLGGPPRPTELTMCGWDSEICVLINPPRALRHAKPSETLISLKK